MSPDPSPKDRLEVLLVEDTLEEALLIRSILESEVGCKVTLAQDGIRGCQLAENQEWSLVITDLNLPGRDGMEVIRSSKERHPDTPVLATTAYSGPYYVDQALRHGADDVLEKPIDRDDLVRRVRALSAAAGRAEAATRTVLAVGAFPGDVELGCGGILLSHRSRGDQVVLVVMSAGGEEDVDIDRRRDEAQQAADVLGAVLIVADAFSSKLPDEEEVTRTVERIVRDYHPETIFAPSHNDVRESRRDTYRGTLSGGPLVPNFYAYQAATSTLDFRPSLFVDVGEFIDRKLQLLELYQAQVEGRPHLDVSLARSTARYWGRFLGYAEVEPLEVVRSGE